MLCYRLPEEQAKKAHERKEAKLKKKYGSKYNHELVWWASWVILVSTTDAAVWSGADVVRMSRARWQIEWLFKQRKQCLRVHGLRRKRLATRQSRVALAPAGLVVASRFEAQWMQQVLSGVLTPCAGEIREVSEPEPPAQGESEEEDWVPSRVDAGAFL